MKKYQLIEECLGYWSAPDKTNTDPRFLVGGSQNVLIDRQRKVHSRGGYSRLGAANTALTPVRSAFTWLTSSGNERALRSYDDELEVYLDSVDGTSVAAWTRVVASLSTTATIRFAQWFDATENIDLLIFIQSDHNIYEWNGAVAVVGSVPGANSVTKTGTTTFAQNRFYTTRNKTFVCVRTGTEYTYTGGESTTTLTGITDTTGLQAGDILIQKIVTQSNKPAATFTNDTIFVFENQLVLGSFLSDQVYLSKNTSYYDFSYSSPRVPGEGGLLTLDGPSGGFGNFGNILICFAGRSGIFRTEYEQITVGTTLAETLKVRKLKTGVDQAAQSPDCIIPIGNGLAYLTYEPALRLIEDASTIEAPKITSLSNPIKPDFDGEDFTNAFGLWFKNAIYLSAPVNSHAYILEFTEDADGKTRRFWQAPQILPVRAFSIISDLLYGHSNSVPESYNLFADSVFSDLSSDDDKLPINAIAAFAYWNGKNRANLKSFDEYFVEGEISTQTNDLSLIINYDFGGHTQQLTENIDGTDLDILEETLLATSLGQQPLGQNPLGGSTNAPDDTAKFRVIFEIAKEDFHEIQAIFQTNEIDRYWAILAHGSNARISPRQNTIIKR